MLCFPVFLIMGKELQRNRKVKNVKGDKSHNEKEIKSSRTFEILPVGSNDPSKKRRVLEGRRTGAAEETIPGGNRHL